jgi:hypothetical protein
MSAVEIRVNPGELSREMGEMRVWLDEHRFEVSGFSCRHQEDGVVVCLEFARAHEAQAFAEHFADGTSARPTADRAEELARGTLRPGRSSSGIVG